MSVLVDTVLLGLLVMVAIVGWHRGGLVILAVVGGLVIGAVAGSVLIHPVALIPGWSNLGPVVALAAAIGGGVALGALASRRRDRKAGGGRRSDAAAGSFAAVSVFLVLAWFILPNLARGPFPGLADVLPKSGIVRALKATLPAPPDLMGSLDRGAAFLGVPGAFAGVPPVPADPVVGDPPTDVRDVATRALASSIEVLGRGCYPGFLNEGSGFVVAPGYVLTAAHVLAGTHDQFLYDGDRYPAEVVAFDDRLDAALLYAPTFHASDLRLLPGSPPRGTWGVVAGFPAGYHPMALDAVVRRSFTVTGRDIYGQGAVSRRLVELQSHVDRGDSGGPFVLTDGSVAGMVFAGSKVDDSVSYAVASSSLTPFVDAAAGSRQPVDVGSCVSSP